MRVKYRAIIGSAFAITPVEIDRETKHYLYFPGTNRRVQKGSEYETYHDSWSEAKAQIVAAQEDIVATLQKWVAKEQALLEKVIELKESKSEN